MEVRQDKLQLAPRVLYEQPQREQLLEDDFPIERNGIATDIAV